MVATRMREADARAGARFAAVALVLPVGIANNAGNVGSARARARSLQVMLDLRWGAKEYW